MKTQSKLIALAFLALFFLLNSCKKEVSSQFSKSVVNKANASPDSMVHVPGGLMVPISHIFLVENGYHLEIRENKVLKVRTSTGELKVLGNIKSPVVDQFTTPGNTKARTLSSNINPPGGAANGWVTFAQLYSPSTAINYMSTSWVVPTNPPSNDGQLFFIFDCLEPASGPNVIQPVLQWGANGGLGGGNYWSISNWYGWNDTSGNSYFAITAALPVTPGTNLAGVINFTGTNGTGSNNYTSGFSGYSNSLNVVQGDTYNGLKNGQLATVVIPSVGQQFYAYETLEAYNISQATDYPNDGFVQMSAIKVLANNTASTASWTPFTNSQYAIFGEHTLINNNSAGGSGQIQLWFHPGNITVNTNMPSNPNLHVVSVSITPVTSPGSGTILNYYNTSTQNYAGGPPSAYYNLQVTTYNQRCHVTINNTYTADNQGGHTYATFNNIQLNSTVQVSVVPF